MKKILSILVCVCVLLSAMVFTASADSATSYAVTETFTSDTAYKFGVEQKNLVKTLYLNGEMSSYYMATTEDAAAAIDVYLEEVAGGYQLYAMVNGAKKYMNIAANAAGTHVNVTYDNAAKSVYTYDTTLKTFITKATKSGTESDYAFGTYGTYNTASPCDIVLHPDNFFFKLYAPVVDGGEDVTPPAGDGDEGEDVTPPAGDGEEETDPDAVNNIVLTVDTLGLPSDNYNADEVTGTVGGVDFSWIQLGNYGNGIQVRDKEGKTSTFWNTTAFDAPIKEIKLVFNSEKATYDNPDAEIFSFGNAAGTYTYEAKLSTVAGTSEYTITPDAETYTFLKFEHDLGYTMYWDSITIVLVGGEDVVTPPAGDEEEDVTPPAGDEDDKEDEKEPELGFGVVADPVAGTAYKFGMVQGNLGKTLFLTGEMDGFYMATTEDKDAAADVYLEETTGGYYIYAMVNGAKKYLGIVEAIGTDGNTHINAVFTDTADSVFTYNDTVKTFVTTVGDKEYGFGTRNDREYTTISPSSTEYTDNFVCQFYGMTVVDNDNATGEGTTGDSNANTDNSTTSPSTGDNVGAIVAMAVAAGAVLVASKKR